MNAAMEASVTGNGVLFFWAILLGAAWGILYDVFRVIRIARGSSCTADKFAAVKRLRAVQLHLPEMRRRSMPSKKKKKSERQKFHITDTVVVFVEDLLFTLTVGLSFIIFVFSANSGMFRWFLLVGAGVGFCAYYCTVGKLVTGCAAFLVALLRALFIMIGNYTLCPLLRLLLWLGGWLVRVASMFKAKIASRYQMYTGRRYTASQSRKLEAEALRGFQME